MEVPYDKGLATHIGPEPRGGAREGSCEASAGECIGQSLNTKDEAANLLQLEAYAKQRRQRADGSMRLCARFRSVRSCIGATRVNRFGHFSHSPAIHHDGQRRPCTIKKAISLKLTVCRRRAGAFESKAVARRPWLAREREMQLAPANRCPERNTTHQKMILSSTIAPIMLG